MIHDLADIAPRPADREIAYWYEKAEEKAIAGIFRRGDAQPKPT
jgi:hypothetical protein